MATKILRKIGKKSKYVYPQKHIYVKKQKNQYI